MTWTPPSDEQRRPAMEIRPAVPGDLPILAEIHTLSWQDAYRGLLPDDNLRNRVRDDLADLWRETRIEPRDLVLVAEQPDIVGFIAV